MEFIDLPARPQAVGTVALPGSKSISNRALLLAALASGETQLSGVLDSDDTRVMRGALAKLGVACSDLGARGDICVTGCGGRFSAADADIFVGNAGTAARTLVGTLALAASPGAAYRVDGVPRMRERPIGDLADALVQIGAAIEYTGSPGFPPLTIRGADIRIDRPIPIRGDVSSQFLTGLLMALPLVTARVGKSAKIEVVGELISKPYIEITLAMMRQFGVVVERDGWQRFTVPATGYVSPGQYTVEGDASSASYFLAAAAIAGGPIRVKGVGRNALQGDVKFADALALMGAQIEWEDHAIIATAPPDGRLRAIQADMNHIPDAAMTLAVVALFAEGTTKLTNIASWRVKETDRIAAMATELRKLGAIVEEGADYIAVTPPKPPSQLTPNTAIDTYDDHRIAMCFSLASLGTRGVPVRINDPKCVNKTFPTYFDVLSSVVDGGRK